MCGFGHSLHCVEKEKGSNFESCHSKHFNSPLTIFLQSRVKVLPPSSVVPSVSIHSFTARSDIGTGHDEQGNSRSGSAPSDTPLLGENGVVDLEEMKCVHAKLDGVSAGDSPPPAVDHTTVQYAGINIRATHVS